MKKWQIILLRMLGIVLLVVSFIMLYLFIFYNRDFSFNYPVATDDIGQYGDFVGGVVGTILSILLLYFTLTLQREDSAKNTKVYKNQQLNDEFFHLIEVYNDILKGFEVNGDDDRFYIGKFAVHKSVENMYDGYMSDQPSTNGRKLAVLAYQEFYARERNFAPVYFRTLYRICQIVDESDCEEDKKVEYVKILRAQLTDSELILMRYNAMTPLGKKFAVYINKYNLLKHIPIFMLLEYKMWRRMMNTSDAYYVSNFLQLLKEEMADLVKSDNVDKRYLKVHKNRKYIIRVSCNTQKNNMTLSLIRRRNVILRDDVSLKSLDYLSFDSLTNLLRYYMKDCFVLNSFNQLNPRTDLDIDYRRREFYNIDVVSVRVKNKKGNSLRFVSLLKNK